VIETETGGGIEKIRNLNLITGERSVDFVQIRFR